MGMKSISDVLQEKERRIEVLKGEIETLKTAARILSDEKQQMPPPPREPVMVATRNWP